MQTLNNPSKQKQVQTQPVGDRDTGVMATSWDMYDTYKALEEASKSAGDGGRFSWSLGCCSKTQENVFTATLKHKVVSLLQQKWVDNLTAENFVISDLQSYRSSVVMNCCDQFSSHL